MIAPSFASVFLISLSQAQAGPDNTGRLERVQIPAERPAAPLPPPDTHSDRKVSAMPSDVNAVDELDLRDLDSPRRRCGCSVSRVTRPPLCGRSPRKPGWPPG